MDRSVLIPVEPSPLPCICHCNKHLPRCDNDTLDGRISYFPCIEPPVIENEIVEEVQVYQI